MKAFGVCFVIMLMVCRIQSPNFRFARPTAKRQSEWRIFCNQDTQSFLFFSVGNNMNGIIKKLTDRGFGFIGAENQEKDLFFHKDSLVNVEFDDLKEGDSVTFDLEKGAKGPAAVNVQRA